MFRLKKALEALLLTITLAVALPFLFELMKVVEGSAFPVVRNVKFSKEGGQWDVSFDKVRPCRLLAVYWFDGKTWTRQVFTTQFTRPVGPALITGYPIPPGIDPETDRSIVRHSCWPFYDVESRFNRP